MNYFWLIFDAIFLVYICELFRTDYNKHELNIFNIICVILILADVTHICYKIFKQV